MSTSSRSWSTTKKTIRASPRSLWASTPRNRSPRSQTTPRMPTRLAGTSRSGCRTSWESWAGSVEARWALLQERRHALARVGRLAGGGHELDRVGVGLRLVEIDLGVEPLLAQRLRVPAAARGPAQEVEAGRVELSGRDDRVHEAPGGRRPGVDRIAGEGHLERALARQRAGDGDHRGVAEPAALAAGGSERRV